MKILLINKFLFPKGGDAIATFNTGRLLKSKGHQVYFWGMANELNGSLSYEETFIPNVNLDQKSSIFNQLKLAVNLLYSFEAKQKITEFLKKEKPDIVHLNNFAHQISPSILDVFKKFKIPCVMTMHDYKPVCASYKLYSKGRLCKLCANSKFYYCFQQKCVKDSAAKSLLNMVEMYLHHSILDIYDHIHCFIAPSLFLKEQVESMGFEKNIVHVFNFIDIEKFIPEYGWKENSITYVGRLSEEKGVKTLINAMVNLPELQLNIIGDGPERKALEEEIESKGIKNIRLLGHMSSDKVYQEIKKSMFMVVPSEWYENNPMSVIEAFALGKPVIGANIGGIPELVKDGETGLTFESGNVDDLVEKIQYAISDEKQLIQWGKAGRAFVEKELNSDKHYKKLMSIYQEALRND